jgi:hypothetical protein
MDFITRLSKVQGRDYIYVVVDRLTKYAHFFVIPSEYSMSQVADIFFREVFRLHDLPRCIFGDCDYKFLSAFWRELFRVTRTKLTPSQWEKGSHEDLFSVTWVEDIILK